VRRFAAFFGTIDRLTTVGAEDFVAAWLKQVSRSTLVKELCQLSRLAHWARRRGHLASMTAIEVPDKRKLGTPVNGARKTECVDARPSGVPPA
jgi:hypothetical protein